MFRRGFVGWAAGALAWVVACARPTLPLPPPAMPTIEISSVPGKVHLASTHGAEPNAIVVIVNRNPAIPRDARVSGTQADEFGSWDADVLASSGDVLDISQEFGNTRSTSTTIQIR